MPTDRFRPIDLNDLDATLPDAERVANADLGATSRNRGNPVLSPLPPASVCPRCTSCTSSKRRAITLQQEILAGRFGGPKETTSTCRSTLALRRSSAPRGLSSTP